MSVKASQPQPENTIPSLKKWMRIVDIAVSKPKHTTGHPPTMIVANKYDVFKDQDRCVEEGSVIDLYLLRMLHNRMYYSNTTCCIVSFLVPDKRVFRQHYDTLLAQ